MIWDFFNNIYAERYWIPLVMILAIIVYVYMLKCRYYSEVLFAVITLIIPFTGGVMSMCRFIAGSYVVYIGLYDYFADKKDLKWLAVFLAVVMEAFLMKIVVDIAQKGEWDRLISSYMVMVYSRCQRIYGVEKESWDE